MKKEEGDGFFFAHGDSWFDDYVVARTLKEELDSNLTSAALMFIGHKPMSLPIGAGIWCHPVVTVEELKQSSGGVCYLSSVFRFGKQGPEEFWIDEKHATTHPFAGIWMEDKENWIANAPHSCGEVDQTWRTCSLL